MYSELPLSQPSSPFPFFFTSVMMKPPPRWPLSEEITCSFWSLPLQRRLRLPSFSRLGACLFLPYERRYLLLYKHPEPFPWTFPLLRPGYRFFQPLRRPVRSLSFPCVKSGMTFYSASPTEHPLPHFFETECVAEIHLPRASPRKPPFPLNSPDLPYLFRLTSLCLVFLGVERFVSGVPFLLLFSPRVTF